jgi:ABC-type proline/glycine betaine transport system ATPase subunit
MMRDEPLVLLLDEPTASLDPEAEDALHQRFKDATEAQRRRGAITLIVSHRFSTVRMADLILVVEGGRVAEAGTHDELVALDGTYAELFALQARPYATASSTVAAVVAVERAFAEAVALNQPVVGQEHLLLALASDPDSLASRAITVATGADQAAAAQQLRGMLTPRPDALSSPPKPTPRTMAALVQAEAEAADANRPVTTADLVIGILRAGEGIGFQILTTANVEAGALRATLAGLLPGHHELTETSALAVTEAAEQTIPV